MEEHRFRAVAREPAADSVECVEQDHLLGCSGFSKLQTERQSEVTCIANCEHPGDTGSSRAAVTTDLGSAVYQLWLSHQRNAGASTCGVWAGRSSPH